MTDARLRSDYFTLARYGPAAVALFKFIEAGEAYLRKAKEMQNKWRHCMSVKQTKKRIQGDIKRQNETLLPYKDRQDSLVEKLKHYTTEKEQAIKEKINLEELLNVCQALASASMSTSIKH
mmetsp:Transcript_15313/g.15495  ORF Transcript_15313/g.15495 Transcript_15313/m.15495 type:complete len:121 (-) Transcript_15313:47-409(-)